MNFPPTLKSRSGRDDGRKSSLNKHRKRHQNITGEAAKYFPRFFPFDDDSGNGEPNNIVYL